MEEEPGRHYESDMTEQLHFHYSLSCIGEGNGNPLHCSCLENPRDGGAWWAAVYGVAQSRTRLSDLAAAAAAAASMSVLMLISHCLNYCSFVTSFKIGKCESFNLVLLFSRLYWLFLGPCNFVCNLGLACPFLKKKKKEKQY